MGVFLSVEPETKPKPESTTIVNNYTTSTPPQKQQQQIPIPPQVNTNNNTYELSIVLLVLWGLPTMIALSIHKYGKYGYGSIYGFILGFLFKMSLN